MLHKKYHNRLHGTHLHCGCILALTAHGRLGKARHQLAILLMQDAPEGGVRTRLRRRHPQAALFHGNGHVYEARPAGGAQPGVQQRQLAHHARPEANDLGPGKRKLR